MSISNRPQKQRRQKNKKTKKGASKVFSLSVKLVLVISLFAIVAVTGIAGGTLYGYVKTAEIPDLKNVNLNFTSFVYYIDEETNQPIELERLYDEENRIWANSSQIPQHLKDAFVAVEDQRFPTHPGVDFKRTLKATLQYILKGNSSEGGSTITQQLIKNLTKDDEVSPRRKVQEMWSALKIERDYSKDQILESYLNTIFLSQGCNGVQSAANTYFGKDVSELTLAESASIAGITQYPTKYDPFQNPENNKKKQELVLKLMLEQEYINQEQYEQAVNEKLNFKRGSKKEQTSKQSYFVDQVISDVLHDLVNEKKYSEQVASKLLYSGGLKIYATVDPKVQKTMDKIFTDDEFFKNNKFPQFKDGQLPQTSMLIMDPYTGAVKGIVGGRGPKKANRVLNRATQTVRQPGSVMKPIGAYAPAMEYGYITPGTVIDDAPVVFNPGTLQEWEPRNYSSDFRGLMTVRTAIELSRNIPAAKVVDLVGIDQSFDFLQKNLGITSLVDNNQRNDGRGDRYLNSLSLGGLTNGISVMEMTAAYAPFINRGIYTRPYTYTKVLDHEGNVILEKKKESHIAMSEQTAFLMTKIMEGVIQRGTATVARLSNHMPAAGKTGTTSDFKDKWFAGYTSYYVGAVWYGFDEAQDMHKLSNGQLGWKANPAAIIWQAVMDELHKDMEIKQFEQPRDIVKVAICRDSGQKPNENCYKDPRGSRVYTEYFKKGTEPREECTVHVREKIDTTNNLLANEYCPPDVVEERVFIVRPEPYTPVSGSSRRPKDAQYELPAGEYCNEHGPTISEDRNTDEERLINLENFLYEAY